METLETLRADLDLLRDERDTLLGLIAGLTKGMTALIQVHPDHDAFHLALHRMIDAQEFGLLTPLTDGKSALAERQILTELLGIRPAPPKTWKPN